MLRDYMADVLAVELTKCLLEDHLKEQNRKKKFAVEYEQPTIEENPGPFLGYLWLVPAALLTALAIGIAWFAIAFFIKNWFFGILVGLGCGWVLLFVLGGLAWFVERFCDSREKHQTDVRIYKTSIERYEDNMKNWRSWKNDIPKIEQKIKMICSDLDAVEQENRRLYSYNIIPSGYRNRWAAYFFYDWFSSCQSEDINYAITQYEKEKSHVEISLRYNKYDTLNKLLKSRDSETIRFLNGLKSLR